MTTSKLIILRGLTGSGKSTVAGILSKTYSEIVVIDVDKIREENATESHCFSKAGRQAKTALDKGATVVVHDAFDNRAHVEMFLEPTGLSLMCAAVYVVRLKCTKDEAHERNRDKPDHKVESWQTEQEYRKDVDELQGEAIICTSNKCASQVAEEIAREVGPVD